MNTEDHHVPCADLSYSETLLHNIVGTQTICMGLNIDQSPDRSVEFEDDPLALSQYNVLIHWIQQ